MQTPPGKHVYTMDYMLRAAVLDACELKSAINPLEKNHFPYWNRGGGGTFGFFLFPSQRIILQQLDQQERQRKGQPKEQNLWQKMQQRVRKSVHVWAVGRETTVDEYE
eukprot:4253256-Amphidinium_carterae.1